VLEVQKVLGEGSTEPTGCSAEGELGGQEKNWGLTPSNIPGNSHPEAASCCAQGGGGR